MKDESTKKVIVLRILRELRYTDSRMVDINEVIGTYNILVK